MGAVVRVVGGQIGECQHLAGARVEHYDAARFCLVRLDCGFELAKGEVLNLAVNRQLQISALARLLNRGHVFDNVAEPVFHHAAATRFACQRILHRELDALLAYVLNAPAALRVVAHLVTLAVARRTCAHEAQHMRSDFARRILAFVLAIEMDAVNAQQRDFVGERKRHAAAPTDEITFLVEQLGVQSLLRKFEQRGQLLQAALVIFDPFGRRFFGDFEAFFDIWNAGPNGAHLGRRGKHFAVPIGDLAANAGHFHHALRARLALFAQKVVVPGLQVDGARHQSQKRDEHHHHHEARTPQR